jgi:hypothetical protein
VRRVDADAVVARVLESVPAPVHADSPPDESERVADAG